jgi:hypothetical protein
MWLGYSISILFNDGVGELMIRDEFWGPLRVEGYLQRITLSLIHSTIVVAILVWCLQREKRGRLSQTGVLAALVLLSAIETSLSARSMLMRIPRATELALVDRYESIDSSKQGRWMRTQSGGGWPRVWSETSNHERPVEVEASGRASLFGRWHLTQGLPVLNNMVSIQSREMDLFWDAAQSLTAGLTNEEQVEFWTSMRRWLGIRGILHTSGSGREIAIGQRRYEMVNRVTRVASNSPGAIRAHWAWTVTEKTPPDLAGITTRLAAIAKGVEGPSIQLRRERNDQLASHRVTAEEGRCTIRTTRQTAESATFEVELSAPALLTRPIFQDGNWSASVESNSSEAARTTEVYQVDFLTQGVILPAGKHRLHFRYRPWWLSGSLVLATIAWLGVTVCITTTFQCRSD